MSNAYTIFIRCLYHEVRRTRMDTARTCVEDPPVMSPSSNASSPLLPLN